MMIQVNFYKSTGKWYSGGEVEINELHLWSDNFNQTLVNNQEILINGWQEHDWVVVTSNIPPGPPRGWFHEHYFPSGSFKGIKKQAKV